MIYKVVATISFEEDLNRITTYIAEELANPVAASALLDAMNECYEKLSFLPMLYEQCRDPKLNMLGCRGAVIGSYICVYRIVEESKTVIILRFFHNKRDYKKVLQDFYF